MNTNECLIQVIFYTKKRYIGEEFFDKNITLYDLKQYYKENYFDGTAILYKNYYINSIKLLDSDNIYNIIFPYSNTSKIKIAIELREVEELKQLLSLTKFDDEDEQVYSQIIKPKLNPFGLIVFFTKNLSIQIEQYPKEIINKYNLDKFNTNSAYCNSPNYLFLSGENNFWIISKKTYSITHLKLKIAKEKHSLVYVPDIGIFVVGGDTKTTFLYDIKFKKFIKWGDTNNYYYKPALIYYDEYLFCFQHINKKIRYFEKTYLGESTKRKWEIIYPRFKNINPKEFYNNNFAVSKSTEGKILLVGGNKSHKYIYIFNPLNDTLIKARGENEKINFYEKIFYKLNKVINIAIPSDFEENYELAILNKYLYSLQKAKYKNVQKNIKLNYEYNIDNNLELINDNQFGNISIRIKLEVINNNKRYKVYKTIGSQVFSTLNFFKYKQQNLRCICQRNINYKSQNNLFKTNIDIRKEVINKRNKSHHNLKRHYGKININKNINKIENNIYNIQKDKRNKENKNVLKIIHKNMEYKKNTNIINNDNQIINCDEITINKQQKQKKIEGEIKYIKEKQNDIIYINNSKYEQQNYLGEDVIKDTKEPEEKNEIINKELIKEEKKFEKINGNNINIENKKDEAFLENKINKFKESVKICEKQNNKNNDAFCIFSKIKEYKDKPNYDIDEDKTNKNMYTKNATNFQLKESIQRNIVTTKFNILSDKKDEDNEKNQNSEMKVQSSEIIESQKKKNEITDKDNINELKFNEIKETDKNKKKEGLYDEKICDNNFSEEERRHKYYEENQYEKEQIEEHNEQENGQNNIKNNLQENLLSSKNNSENKEKLEDEIKQEINRQNVHEDIEPNQMINVKGNNIIIQHKYYNENLEDNLAQKIDEENIDNNEIDSEQNENIINNEQDSSKNSINNSNEGLFNLNIESKEKNEENHLGTKVIISESILDIKKNPEEINKKGKEENHPLKKNENILEQKPQVNNLEINPKSQINEEKYGKNYKDSTVRINMDDINNIENKTGERENEAKYKEIDNKVFNNEEGEQEIVDNDYEENIDEEMGLENYEYQNEEIENDFEYNNDVGGISYELDDENEKEKEKDSIIQISDEEKNYQGENKE